MCQAAQSNLCSGENLVRGRQHLASERYKILQIFRNFRGKIILKSRNDVCKMSKFFRGSQNANRGTQAQKTLNKFKI